MLFLVTAAAADDSQTEEQQRTFGSSLSDEDLSAIATIEREVAASAIIAQGLFSCKTGSAHGTIKVFAAHHHT